MPVISLEEVAGNWSRDLGGDRSSGRLPCPVQGLSSSPSSHTGIVSDVPGRLSSGSSLAARGRGDACQRSLRNRRDPGPGFYSRLFLVEKATGGWRPVIDLSHLNDFVQLTPFKMETVASVLLSVREGDFLASLDLKDAYFQIPIHGSSRKLLRFMSKGTVYQFKALCFGLSTAPQVFTRVFARCRLGLTLAVSDCSVTWTIGWSSPPRRRRPRSRSGSSSRFVAPSGLWINEKKSDLVPSQSAKYLGMTIDTGAGKVLPSLARVEKFFTVAERFCSMQSPPSSALAGDLGSPGFAGAVGSSRSTSDALLAVASEVPVVPRVRPSLASGGFAGGSETGPVLVDGEGSPVSGGSIRDTCSGSTPVFGRVFVGLGCSPPRSKRVRGVGPPRRSCCTSIFSK